MCKRNSCIVYILLSIYSVIVYILYLFVLQHMSILWLVSLYERLQLTLDTRENLEIFQNAQRTHCLIFPNTGFMIVLRILRRERESILCYKKNKNALVEYRAKNFSKLWSFFQIYLTCYVDVWDLIVDFTNDYFRIILKKRKDSCMSMMLKSELSDTNI